MYWFFFFLHLPRYENLPDRPKAGKQKKFISTPMEHHNEHKFLLLFLPFMRIATLPVTFFMATVYSLTCG